jgi:hypothetical protein
MAQISVDELPIDELPEVSIDHDTPELLRVVEQEGVIRLSELADELRRDRSDLYGPLVRHLEKGKLSLFPVGDSVQVRHES